MGNRSINFFKGVVTGYAAIATNVLYTIFSIPLALHYLGKDEFGLWALAQQISGYMLLLDFGMSNAIARFYSNYKDDVKSNEYKLLFSTSIYVYAIQGCLVTLGGTFFSFIAPVIFHIPSNLVRPFQITLIIITFSSGISIALRSIGGPIWSFQRMDITNLLAILSLISNFILLFIGFHLGWGIYSLALAVIPAVIITPVVAYIVCSNSGYYPVNYRIQKPSKELFFRLFNFGRDTMFLSLGQQLVNASQIMLISRCISLDAAATFSVGVKIYSLGQQFISKILESSAAGLTELYVRGNFEKFKKRFWNIFIFSIILSLFVSIVIVLGNQKLIYIWTKGCIDWPVRCDYILALLIIATTVSRCFTGLFNLIGNVRPIRTLYFSEGILFIVLALFSAKHYGIIGVLITSLIAHIFVTLFRSQYIAKKYLSIN